MQNHEDPVQRSKKTQKIQQKQKNYNILGILGLVGGLLIHVIIGSLYQWGIISIYITSYFNLLDQSVTLQSTAIAFPLMMISFGFTMKLGISLSQLTHPSFLMTLVQLFTAGIIFATSYIVNIWIFIFMFGILFGLFQGMNFMVPIVECNKYFPGKKMYINGFILIGTGVGPVIFGLFSYNYLNPNKLNPLSGYYVGNYQLEEISFKVPSLIRWLALLYLCIGLLGCLLLGPVCIKNRKQDNRIKQQLIMKQLKQKQHQNHNYNQINKQLDKITIIQINQAKSLKQAFCSLICWLQSLILILGTCGLFLINGNYKLYVRNTIPDDYFLTIIGVIGALGNGFSRLIWNIFFSKTGYKTVMLCVMIISIIVFSTIRFTVDKKAGYLIEVFLLNVCIGAYLVTTPTVVQAVFGQRTGSNIYGFYWIMFSLANFIQYAFVISLKNTIGFTNIIYICLGMCVLAVILLVSTTFQGPWKNQTLVLEYSLNKQIQRKQEKIKQLIIQQLQRQKQQQQLRNQFLIHLKIMQPSQIQLQEQSIKIYQQLSLQQIDQPSLKSKKQQTI